ncbi:hypothetical protein ACTFIW_003285 [Dictyostelium discoideum]
MNSKLKMTVAHRAQADVQTERMNREIIRILTNASTEYGEKWSDIILLIEFAMNSSMSKSTKMSPFQIIYGLNPPTPVNHFNSLTKTRIPMNNIKDRWSDTRSLSSRAYSRILQCKSRPPQPSFRDESQIIVQSNQELQLATEEGSVQSHPTSVRSNPDGSVHISPEPSNVQLLNNQNECTPPRLESMEALVYNQSYPQKTLVLCKMFGLARSSDLVKWSCNGLIITPDSIKGQVINAKEHRKGFLSILKLTSFDDTYSL